MPLEDMPRPKQFGIEPHEIITSEEESYARFANGLLVRLENTEPRHWWRQTVRYLVETTREMEQNPEDWPEAIQIFLNKKIEEVRDAILANHDARTPDGHENDGTDTTAVLANKINSEQEDNHKRVSSFVHRVADPHLDTEPGMEHERLEIIEMSWEEITKIDPERLEIKETENGQLVRVRAGASDRWHSFPLPDRPDIWYKGGPGRIIGKIATGAPQDILEAELPLNDLDAIVSSQDEGAYEAAIAMGVDPEGVETCHDFDIQEIFNSRDVNLNQVIVGRGGITLTRDAQEAFKNGHMKIVTTRERVYGPDRLVYGGEHLFATRAIVRLMKFVAEGKARSFDFKPLNNQIDLGVYWLALARKLADKPNAGTVMRRTYALAQQMGYARPNEKDIYDILTRAHTEHSYFDPESAKQDDTGVSLWLIGKLLKLGRRKLRKENKLPSNLELNRTPGDTEPRRVSLDDYMPSPEEEVDLADRWPEFLRACRQRYKEFHAKNSESLKAVLQESG